MRKSFTASLALVAILTVAVPTVAAPGKMGPRTEITARGTDTGSGFTKIIRMLKRFFGVQVTADPVSPIPAPTPDGEQ